MRRRQIVAEQSFPSLARHLALATVVAVGAERAALESSARSSIVAVAIACKGASRAAQLLHTFDAVGPACTGAAVGAVCAERAVVKLGARSAVVTLAIT